MMSYRLRPATAADTQEMFETQVAAFGEVEGTLRWESARSYCFERTEQHIVFVDESGHVAGLVHIHDHPIQVGSCAVRKADVGHVAIGPELQGQGIGTRMMQETVAWLREEGYHLSRLGGRVSFYSRFGYEPFPRRFVQIKLGPVPIGGGSALPAREAFADPGEWPGQVRPYDESRDLGDRTRLRWEYDHGRSGALVVERECHPGRHPAPPDPTALRWVYEREGEVLGYLHAVEAPLESTESETVFTIAEFAYAPAFPDAAGALMRMLLSRICDREPARVTSRLPFDEALSEALQAAEIPHERLEMYQAMASNMILVVNLAATLRAITNELSRRLAGSLVAGWEGALELSLPAERCMLEVTGGEVVVSRTSGPADLRLELTQAQFVKALFGIAGLTEMPPARGASLSPTLRGLLDALFPRLPAGSGPWG